MGLGIQTNFRIRVRCIIADFEEVWSFLLLIGVCCSCGDWLWVFQQNSWEIMVFAMCMYFFGTTEKLSGLEVLSFSGVGAYDCQSTFNSKRLGWCIDKRKTRTHWVIEVPVVQRIAFEWPVDMHAWLRWAFQRRPWLSWSAGATSKSAHPRTWKMAAINLCTCEYKHYIDQVSRPGFSCQGHTRNLTNTRILHDYSSQIQQMVA